MSYSPTSSHEVVYWSILSVNKIIYVILHLFCNTINGHQNLISTLLKLCGVKLPFILSLSISASRNVFCTRDINVSVCSVVLRSSPLAISLSPASGISHSLRFYSVSDWLHNNISASATDPSILSLLPLMFSFFRYVLWSSPLAISLSPASGISHH